MKDLDHLKQWLENGGSVEIKGRDINSIYVRIGDAGGYPPDMVKTFSSAVDALEWADLQAEKAILSAQEIVSMYKSGDIPWPEEGYLKIPGIGIVHKNET